MGYLEDQRLPGEREEDERLQRQQQNNLPPPPAYAPTLPPRELSSSELRIHANTESTVRDDLSTYAAQQNSNEHADWSSRDDPRNASTDSLVPQTNRDGRRKLLLIYVHGFMGDETSFQSFPAHIHHVVTDLLAPSHIVHTKIYPRYKSRRAIEFARDEFSNWLRPHESAHTDVLLLGHSMGGILSAEVVLKPLNPPRDSPFVHRILGTIDFDVPFLGMHPGVIASGLGSLFRPADKTPEPETAAPRADLPMLPAEIDGSERLVSDSAMAYRTASPRSGTQSPADSNLVSRSVSQLSIPVDDPNYNPQFENDVVRPVRKGWESALHFVNKHSGSLRQAAKAYVTSHVEFGGTMADYPKLHARYRKIRALEDIDDRRRTGNHNSRTPRVRFVNFYTASTGVPPRTKNKSVSGDGRPGIQNLETPSQIREEGDFFSNVSADANHPTTPAISVENFGDEGETNKAETDQAERVSSTNSKVSSAGGELSHVDPQAEEITTPDPASNQTPIISVEGLPPIPDEPVKPSEFDPTAYDDKDVLKLAQKDHSRKMKTYQSAVKDREKAIVDRQKMLEKRQKKAAKEEEKAMKDKQKAAKEEAKAVEKAAKLKEKEEQEAKATAKATTELTQASTVILSQDTSGTAGEQKSDEVGKEKKHRDRKFCITPTKQNGVMDPAWVRVFMEGVDEVGAHCGLFFQDKPHYEGLVRDVANVIQEWVKRDDSVRHDS